MTISTVTVTENTNTKTLFKKYLKHAKPITGLIEIGGDFSNGTVKFFISLTNGDVINEWRFVNGCDFEAIGATTREFCLPLLNASGSGTVGLYYTLNEAVSPSITLTIGDNT